MLKKILPRIPRKMYLVLDTIFCNLAGRIQLVVWGGKKITCPFCNYSFSKFLPAGYNHGVLTENRIIGGGRRDNAKCPYCGCLDRERLVYWLMQSKDLLQSSTCLLHIAPEKNLQKQICKKITAYVAADLNSPFATLKMDIQKIPFPAGYFDAVICNHVLEHITDDRKAMEEIYRVVKPGGWAILQVPFSSIREHTFEDASVTGSRDREKVFGQSDHVRIYGLDYPQRLSAVGFLVSQVYADEAAVKLYCLNPAEPVFFCKK